MTKELWASYRQTEATAVVREPAATKHVHLSHKQMLGARSDTNSLDLSHALHVILQHLKAETELYCPLARHGFEKKQRY